VEALLISFLGPALGFLLRKGEDAVGDAVKALGSAAWERAQGLWTKLWPRVQEDETARQAAEAVAKDPKDAAAKGALQFRLRALLEADPELATQLGQMLDEAKSAGVMADNGDMIIQGDQRQIADRSSVVAGRDISGDVTTGRAE
jgi:hypothetical protein